MTQLASEIIALSLPMSRYTDGTYYFIVVAHNDYGDTLSNCIQIVVKIQQIVPGYDIALLLGTIIMIGVYIARKKLDAKIR